MMGCAERFIEQGRQEGMQQGIAARQAGRSSDDPAAATAIKIRRRTRSGAPKNRACRPADAAGMVERVLTAAGIEQIIGD